jgi:hypothetical protein
MGSNGESVNWLPDGLIITSVPPEPQGTTATCAVTAKSNTRFPFDPREPWTLVAGPFHSLRPVTSIQQSQAGPILYLLMTQLLAIFFSDVVRVFRVIIIARFHSYRHNHQQKRGSVAAPNDFILFFFFVLNFY